VVDDNPGYRTVICHLVDVAGGKVKSVATLAQARHQLVEGKGFDMVIVGTSSESPVTPEDLRMLRLVAQSSVIHFGLQQAAWIEKQKLLANTVDIDPELLN
jgi:hypothetical protein